MHLLDHCAISEKQAQERLPSESKQAPFRFYPKEVKNERAYQSEQGVANLFEILRICRFHFMSCFCRIEGLFSIA